MEKNSARSERTQEKAIQAALTIIARDGAHRLTLDAIARESGVSKGGVTHQFPSKEAVLKALLEHQVESFEEFAKNYMKEHAENHQYPQLATQIATIHEALVQADSAAYAIVGAITQEPKLLPSLQKIDKSILDIIKEEADNPDIAILRWTAARGLILTSLLGFCPLSKKDRNRLFNYLLDDKNWEALNKKKR